MNDGSDAVEINEGNPEPSSLEGLKALNLAVLKEAIQCLQGMELRSARSRQLAQRARRWFESDDWESVFSFNNVCATLDVAPSWVRGRLPDTVREGRAASRRVDRRTGVRPLRDRTRRPSFEPESLSEMA